MKKILIIDDDIDIVEAMKIVLESKGYGVVPAYNPEEGLDKLKQENPDLIILDVMMDGGNEGFDFARKIKEVEEYKNIPILMLTAIKGETGLDFKGEAGNETWLPVDAFCDKPLKPEELIMKIEELI